MHMCKLVSLASFVIIMALFSKLILVFAIFSSHFYLLLHLIPFSLNLFCNCKNIIADRFVDTVCIYYLGIISLFLLNLTFGVFLVRVEHLALEKFLCL